MHDAHCFPTTEVLKVTQRVLGPTGSRRRRRFLIAPILLAALAALFVIGGAQAIHNPGDTSLELDRNVADNPAGAPDDWNSFFPNAPGDVTFTTGIVADPEPQTIFTGAQSGGSSKDNQDISGWRWKCGSVPAKDEIADAASALYNVGTEQRLYFMADREAVNGDSHLGVWFLKKRLDTVPSPPTCPAGSANPFSDVHSVGDILVLSDFTTGGTISNIKVFKWVGTGGTEPKSNGTMDRIGLGTDCIGLVHNPGDPELCGTVNNVLLGPGNGPDGVAGTDDDGPDWPYTPKSGANGSYPPGSFFEGGIDLGSIGLTGQCFGSVLTETRSSAEIDAVLKDFVLHAFEQCNATMDTSPSAGPYAVGSPVTDTATITVTGSGAPAPTGEVKFYVCGPTPGLTSCDATGNNFSNVTITDTTPPYTVTSGNFTPTAPGDYCFFASWAGDTHYPDGASHDGANECFTVPKVPSSVATQVRNASDADITGTSVVQGTVVHDHATVTGSAGGPTPTGTVTFTLYSTIDCTGAARPAPPTNPETVTLSGGQADSTAWTPAAGSYSYTASYSGDGFYLPSGPSACEPFTIINPTTTFNKQAAVQTQVTYTFAETNDGSVALNPPVAGDRTSLVQDSQCSSVSFSSGDTNGNSVLDPNETWNFTCTHTYTGAGTFTNVATGHGIDPINLDVTWCADPSNPPAGVRCDQDERDTTSVTVSIDQGK
jgi:Bacterial Ig-like domain (group 3)